MCKVGLTQKMLAQFWVNLVPVCPPLFSPSGSPRGRKVMALMTSWQSGVFGNVGRANWDLSSWRLTAEKYLSAAFLLSLPFCFLFDSDSSQLTPCLRRSRPNDELPFLLYLEHTEFQSCNSSSCKITFFLFQRPDDQESPSHSEEWVVLNILCIGKYCNWHEQG